MTLKPNTEGGALRMASTGHIHIQELAIPPMDVVIVAGGEILVEKIESVGHRKRKATFISLGSSVSIRTIDPLVEVLALGYEGVSIPKTSITPPFPQLDLRLPSIRSICIPP